MEEATAPPVTAEPRDQSTNPRPEEQDLGQQQYHQMATAAAAGLMAHQHVESAIVTISGSAGDLVFHLNCALIPDIDQAAVMELVTQGVVPNIERLIGERFVSRDLRFSFAPTP